MEQSDRIAEFDRFKNAEITVLVASDVAARGLDVKGVSHVINFDVPWQPDDYIHRIGRTGRAGMTGIAITLAAREDGEAVSRIEKLIGHKIPRLGFAATTPRADEGEASPAPKREKAEAKPAAPREKRAKRAEPAERAKPAKPGQAAAPAETAEPAERSPVVEDIKSDWNGPLPGFLSVSAGE
jgi:superfamily II DNA/RNA helicase